MTRHSLDAPSADTAAVPSRDRLGRWLFAASLAVLLASRLYRVQDFPIYFFCDEAIHAVLAADFLRDDLRDEFHQLFPTFFHNGPFFNLSASVYAQILPVLGLVPRMRKSVAVPAVVFVLLLGVQAAMLRDALVNGPIWYRDYGLGGMQYGARQVFGEVGRRRHADPNARFDVSPDWANGTSDLRTFFVGYDERVQMHGLGWFLAERRPEVEKGVVVVLTSDEHRAVTSGSRLRILSESGAIPYPDGSDGFHFVRRGYAPDFEAQVQADRDVRHALLTEDVSIGGNTVQTAHSRFDVGRIADVFDGRSDTLVRTDRVNPAVFEVTFSPPREVGWFAVTTGSMSPRLTVRVWRTGSTEPEDRSGEFRNLPPDPTVRLALGPGKVERLRLEVFQVGQAEDAHVHVRDIGFEP
jgi:hypothetical protein